MNHIERAISIFGTQQSMAKACGVSQVTIHKWLIGTKVRPENALSIQKATKGEVTVHDLRPDIFGEAA